MALPKDTVFTSIANEPEVAELLEKQKTPKKYGRIPPFVVFKKRAVVNPLGAGDIVTKLFVFDVTGKKDADDVRHYVRKGWPIVAYRIRSGDYRAGSTTIQHFGGRASESEIGKTAHSLLERDLMDLTARYDSVDRTEFEKLLEENQSLKAKVERDEQANTDAGRSESSGSSKVEKKPSGSKGSGSAKAAESAAN